MLWDGDRWRVFFYFYMPVFNLQPWQVAWIFIFILIIPQITAGRLKASACKTLNRKVGLGSASLKIRPGSTLSSAAVFICNFFQNVFSTKEARNGPLLRPAGSPGRGRPPRGPGRARRSRPSRSNFYSGWWKEPPSPGVKGQRADGLWGFWPNPLLLTGFIAWEDELVTFYI